MAIAIKSFEKQDIENFEKFLTTERKPLPELKLAPLVHPHEDIAVVAFKKEVQASPLLEFAEKYNFVFCAHDQKIVSLSRHTPAVSADHKKYIFSGYAFYEGKMLIGAEETAKAVSDIEGLGECCGEFCLCVVGNGNISLSADYFGMVPWFYFESSEVFAASDNYHCLLLLLASLQIKLRMNIARSRVNVITTGFTYGSSFSRELDVEGCKMSLAYEKISYSATGGLRVGNTSLWNVFSERTAWDEDVYEEYIRAAKDELYEYCKAVFEHPRFKRIVLDVSGGFDSRLSFATANNLPKKLRKKMYTFTRKSGTGDDVEKASAITNMYEYPKHTYAGADTSALYDADGKINLAHVSRNLGTYAVCSYLYSSEYYDEETIELTGYLGEVIAGFKRCRGELDYSLGDKRLLARLGGSYWWNSVEELQEVFRDRDRIIDGTLERYPCDCLFKKFHMLYLDFRNRFICNSSHNVENNNMRIPMLFSKNALKAKWMYFDLFTGNAIPDEKISIDLLNAINPLLACLPFASDNDDVIPKRENLLNPARTELRLDFTFKNGPSVQSAKDLYKDKVIKYMRDLTPVKQMILQIYDYSVEYYPVCLALHKMIGIVEKDDSELTTSHTRETIRKVYDLFYQIQIVGAREA